MATGKPVRNIQSVMQQAHSMMDTVKKNSKNPFFKSNYADINIVLETIAPVCESLGLVVFQAPRIIDGNDVLYTKISLADNPNEFEDGQMRLLLPSADMQKLGSAVSYARRYSLVAMFNLQQEDDDGQSASKHPTATQKRNLQINKAMDQLVKAQKEKDTDTAKQIFDWAEANGHVQVQDKYIQLFEGE